MFSKALKILKNVLYWSLLIVGKE